MLIVFVVFIHNGVIDKGINFADGAQVFEAPFYVAKAKELAGTFTSIAVPLFFLISGFLLFIKEPKYVENLKKKCQTILLPYILWAILVILFLFTAQSFDFIKPYFANLIVRDFSPMDWIGALVGHFGKFSEPYAHPLVHQFWFLRDLFVLNILFVIIKKIIDLCPGGAFVLFSLLWIGGVNIYIVNAGALFFFALGYYIVKYNINYKHLDTIKTLDMVIMYIITIITSLFFREKITIISAMNIIVGIMFFVKLSRTFIKEDKIYTLLAWLEQYSFWVYATHGIVIAAMIKLSVKIMPMNGGWLLVHYYGNVIMYFCLGWYWNNIQENISKNIFSIDWREIKIVKAKPASHNRIVCASLLIAGMVICCAPSHPCNCPRKRAFFHTTEGYAKLRLKFFDWKAGIHNPELAPGYFH